MKLKFHERLGFGLGDFGSQFSFYVVNTYFMLFMTNVMMIPSAAAGAIYAIVMIFDAINDPIIGSMADHTRKTKLGKYRKWMIGFAVPYAVSMWLSFLAPGVGMGARIAYALIIHMAYTICATAFQVPYGSISNRMTTDPQERAVLGAFRDWFANLAKFIIGLVAVNLIYAFSADGASMDSKGFFGMGVIFAIVGAVFCLISGLSVKERVEANDDLVAEKHEKASAFKAMGTIFKSKPCMLIMVSAFLAQFAATFKAAFTSYYALYVMGSAAAITIIMTLFGVVPLVGNLISPFVLKHLGTKKTFMLSMAFLAISGVVSLISTNMVLVIVSALALGIMISFLPPALWATLPNLADYVEWESGYSSPGTIYAMNSFFMKCGNGLTGLITGFVLAAVGYDATAAIQSAGCVSGLNLCYGIVPIAAGIVAVILIVNYKLTPEMLATAQKELAERRAAKAAASRKAAQ